MTWAGISAPQAIAMTKFLVMELPLERKVKKYLPIVSSRRFVASIQYTKRNMEKIQQLRDMIV